MAFALLVILNKTEKRKTILFGAHRGGEKKHVMDERSVFGKHARMRMCMRGHCAKENFNENPRELLHGVWAKSIGLQTSGREHLLFRNVALLILIGTNVAIYEQIGFSFNILYSKLVSGRAKNSFALIFRLNSMYIISPLFALARKYIRFMVA